MGKIYSAIEKSRQEKGMPPKPAQPVVNVKTRVENEGAPAVVFQPSPDLNKVDDKLVTLSSSQSLASEQFKKLKTNLMDSQKVTR